MDLSPLRLAWHVHAAVTGIGSACVASPNSVSNLMSAIVAVGYLANKSVTIHCWLPVGVPRPLASGPESWRNEQCVSVDTFVAEASEGGADVCPDKPSGFTFCGRRGRSLFFFFFHEPALVDAVGLGVHVGTGGGEDVGGR